MCVRLCVHAVKVKSEYLNGRSTLARFPAACGALLFADGMSGVIA